MQLSENGAIVFFQKQPTIGKQGQSSLSLGRMIKAAGPYKNRKNISFIEKECMGNQHIYGTYKIVIFVSGNDPCGSIMAVLCGCPVAFASVKIRT